MTSYQPADWHDLFVASAGAAAALTGLIFVAVSINLADILADRRLLIRAAETLSLLLGLLLLSVFVLVPAQGRVALGSEVGGLGLVMAAVLLATRVRLPREAGEPLTWSLVPLMVILGGTAPMIVAGFSVLAGAGGGLYWLLPELILGFSGAILNAWILLVEIKR
jgi:modulator of FtsH protease